MAQISDQLYIDYAYQFHLSQEAMAGADTYLLAALNEVVDLTTATSSAVDVELALLQVTKTAYTSLTNSVNSIVSTLGAVRAINNYVISNYVGAETTATAKLTEFIDALDWTSESVSGSPPAFNLVPCYWESLCLSAGFETSGWANIDPSCTN